MPLMSPSAGVANRGPDKGPVGRTDAHPPSPPGAVQLTTVSGRMVCCPALSLRLKVCGVVASVDCVGHEAEIHLPVRGREIGDGQLALEVSGFDDDRQGLSRLVPTREDSLTGKTKEPSELKLSLITP